MNKINSLYPVYWQDYINNRPIGGADGIAYEKELRQLNLDATLSSLKSIDVFLDKIHQGIVNKCQQQGCHVADVKVQDTYLKNNQFKKLLIFIGYYTVRVLAAVYKFDPLWLSKQERSSLANPRSLPAHLASLSASAQQLVDTMAARFVDQDKQRYLAETATASAENAWLFFVLEPVLCRVFGIKNAALEDSFDLNTINLADNLAGVDFDALYVQAVKSAGVSHACQPTSSVYTAVLQRLPKAVVINLLKKELAIPQQAVQKKAVQQKELQTSSDKQSANLTQLLHNDATKQRVQNISEQPTANKTTNTLTSALFTGTLASESVKKTTTDELDSSHAPNKVEDSSNKHKSSANQSKQSTTVKDKAEKKSKAKPAYKGAYAEAWDDLKNIEVAQTAANDVYEKVKPVLFKFDEYRYQADLPIAQLSFDKDKQRILSAALTSLQNAAEQGNTSAMLHLALYQLEESWLPIDKESAAEYTKTAANNDDMRAMKLLSKLHNQGEGVEQDVERGMYWLEEAANAGHPEALAVRNKILLAKTLIEDQKKDEVSDKRYLLLFAGVMIFMLLIFILV